MRIVIDIEGDEVKVHRYAGETLPPADMLAKAAAIGAESAGAAPVSSATLAESAAQAEDAGKARLEPREPKSARRRRK